MSRLKSMKRMGVILSSLAVGSFGIIAAASSSPAAASSGYQSQHAGGTLHLVATAAGGTLDPQVNYTLQYWQLYQATYDGLRRVPEGRRRRVLRRRAGPRDRDAQGDQRRQDLYVHAAQGHQVLQRPERDGRRRARDLPATLQGLEPQRRLVVQRHRRGTGVRHDARDVQAHRWRRGERRDQLGRVQPHRAGL